MSNLPSMSMAGFNSAVLVKGEFLTDSRGHGSLQIENVKRALTWIVKKHKKVKPKSQGDYALNLWFVLT